MTKSFIDDHEKENYIGGKFNMRKKALGIAAVAAAMTLSTGITAFAAGWVTESTPTVISRNMCTITATGRLATGLPIRILSWFIIWIRMDTA